MPMDFGTHHFLNSSGCVHASNTRRAGPSNVRVTTSSRSDVRSTVTAFRSTAGSLLLLATIDLLLELQFFDDFVQCAEPRVPQLVIPIDPRRHFLEAARADPTCAYAPDLLGADEARVLQDTHVLLH